MIDAERLELGKRISTRYANGEPLSSFDPDEVAAFEAYLRHRIARARRWGAFAYCPVGQDPGPP